MTENTNSRHPGESENQTDPTDTASSTAAGPALASIDQTVEEVLPILPKGFVENTAEVYAEVASYDILPPEKLRDYWRVYTITNRRLCDPTAQRLESFWWHVWGSKLRDSSGDTLAKLYKSISTGPTFVPLRGPANRYEGPQIPARAQLQAPRDAETREENHQPSQVHLSSNSGTADSKDRDRTYGGGTESRNCNAAADDTEVTQQSIGATADDEAQPQAPVKVLSSSASRPPPAQSILRKPRSASPGSRPTPRFTLPADIPTQDGPDNHASAGTADTIGSSSFVSGSGSTSSGLTAAPSLSSAGSSRSGPRKQGEHMQTGTRHAKKKFVATSSKRKALVLKRSGSQVPSSAADAFGLQDTRRLQSPKSSLGDHPTPGGITEHIASFPTKPKPPVSSIPPEDELAILRSLQRQQQPHKQAASSPLMCDTTATDKQAAQQRDSPLEDSPSAKSAVAGLTDFQGTDSPLTDVVPPETRSQHQNPEPVPTSMARRTALSAGASALDISVGSREILGRPSSRLIRQMTLPQEIRQTAAPTSAARSFASPSTSLEAATTFRPLTPRAGSYVAPMLLRSASQDGSAFLSRSGETAASPTLSPPGMGAAALATPSMVAATGVFSETDGPDPFRVYATTGLNDHLDDDDDDQLGPSFHLERSSFSYTDPNPLHRPLFTPTRPSPTPRIPFARTRSQLNVILDREKERLGQGTFDSWQESRTGRDPPRAAEGNELQDAGPR